MDVLAISLSFLSLKTDIYCLSIWNTKWKFDSKTTKQLKNTIKASSIWIKAPKRINDGYIFKETLWV